MEDVERKINIVLIPFPLNKVADALNNAKLKIGVIEAARGLLWLIISDGDDTSVHCEDGSLRLFEALVAIRNTKNSEMLANPSREYQNFIFLRICVFAEIFFNRCRSATN